VVLHGDEKEARLNKLALPDSSVGSRINMEI